MAGMERRRSSSTQPRPSSFKFPEVTHEQMHTGFDEKELEEISRGPSPQPLPNGLPAGMHSSERWPARNSMRESWTSWANGSAVGGSRHGRQKSLSEAIMTIRARRASISENAHEIADSLKAPVSMKLVVRICARSAVNSRTFHADRFPRFSAACGLHLRS